MESLALTVFLALPLHTISQEVTSYKGAVVEYATHWNPALDVETNTLNNAKSYVEIIKNTTQKYGPLDIIVFPEIGLTGLNTSYYTKIPQINQVPTPQLKVLKTLSDGAKSFNTYLVVNLQEIFEESNGTTKKYNTDVVLDREGRILARYRKYNLFGEYHLDKPALELINFTTDFGVSFGIFTCFDILFNEPALGLVRNHGIKHIVYPTAWFSQLPFLAANQQQKAWSYTNDVTLLASGWVNTATGSGGTGIYFGKSLRPPKYIFSTENKSSVVVADVAISEVTSERVGMSDVPDAPDEVVYSYLNNTVKVLHENLQAYTTVPGPGPCWDRKQYEASTVMSIPVLTQTCTEHTIVTDRALHCEFVVKGRATYVNEEAIESWPFPNNFNTYYLLAFNGVRSFEDVGTGGLQACGIFLCLQSDSESCSHIPFTTSLRNRVIINDTAYRLVDVTILKFEARSNMSADYIAPNIALGSRETDMFVKVPLNQHMTFQSLPHKAFLVVDHPGIVNGGLFGRVFSRDGQPPSTGHSNSSFGQKYWITLFIVVLALLYKIK